MTRRRRILLIAAVLVVFLIGAAWMVLHSSSLHREVADRVTVAIEEQTGWKIEIDDPRFRLWPARLQTGRLSASVEGVELVSVDGIEARWHWSSVVETPRHFDEIIIRGLDFDFRDPPSLPQMPVDEASTDVDPWRVVEIDRLIIEGRGGTAGALDLTARFDGLSVQAGLIDGEASVDLRAKNTVVARSDRLLGLGSVRAQLDANAAGLEVSELTIDGENLRGRVEGGWSLSEGGGSADFDLAADLRSALEFWDPNLVSGLDPSGRLELKGDASIAADGAIDVSAAHHGGRLAIAGYDLDELSIAYAGGIPEIEVAAESWGRARVSVDDLGLATVHARLREAPVESLLAFAAPNAAAVVDGPLSLTGAIDGTVAYPFSLDTLSGRIDLEAVNRRGRAVIRGEGRADEWSVEAFQIDLEGITVEGGGEIRSGGRVTATVNVAVDDMQAVKTLIAGRVPGLDLVGDESGPASGRVIVTGTFFEPRYEAEIEWIGPVIADQDLTRIGLDLRGDAGGADFSTQVTVDEGIDLAANGHVGLEDLDVDGEWHMEVDNLHRVAEFAPEGPQTETELTGTLDGRGRFSVLDGRWAMDGDINAFGLGAGPWRVEQALAVFSADSEEVELSKISVTAYGGTAVGSGSVGLAGLGSDLSAELEWRDVDLGQVPAEMRMIGAGITEGLLEIAGTVSEPTGTVRINWRPADPNSKMPEMTMAGALTDGRLTFITEEVSTDAGAFLIEGEAPVGLIPRPSWLWSDAPTGELRLTASGRGLESDPVAELIGRGDLPFDATADLQVDASWHPDRPEQTRILAELRNLRLQHVGGEIVAQGPLAVSADGHRFELAPVVLTGPQTRIEVAGKGDLETGEIDGRLEAVVAPTIARMIPYPVQIYQPIRLSAAATGTFDDPRVAVTIRHPSGALVLRDPALQIRDLVLSAEVIDGRLWVTDGRAEVNQGRVELGGGWDRESGQGIVAEVENVVVFAEGILSQWSGALAIEPEAGRLARVTGELSLIAGLWDQDVSLGGALFGSATLLPSSDDPLYDVVLDLDVRGRGIVRVENNLGRFDARWDVLRVTGNAAEPEIRGKISIAPGGRLSLAGRHVTVRRGSLVFTGDPAIDPVMEIVPESDLAVFAAGGDQIDTTSLAAQGLVGGLAGALGFENETLQPAEISVEVEKDSSQQLMIGQRLSHNMAVFFATNTTDVQDRTSMLQLWNLPGLKGLALQGYQKTLTNEAGANLVQRFQWGGSSLYEDRPTIRKLKLEGEWPISKRRLRKVTSFRRGQPYDPFLTFVAKVRMERELAGEGYQEATVTASAVESNNAWTMLFECDPGTRKAVVFKGDVPPRRVREEVTALYQPAPLEGVGFRNMASALDRNLDADGFPDAAILVERRGDEVVAEIHRGDGIELTGPVVVGASPALNRAVQERLGSATELAMLPANDNRAKHIVERVLVGLGYPDAVFESATKVALDEKRSEVRIEAELGVRAVVAELVVTGGDPLGLTRADDFGLLVGSQLSRGKVDLAASQLRAGYDSAGYSDAWVTGSMEEIAEGDWRVSIHIEPGGRRTVREVEIVGLKHTNPKVLQSGITVEEGEILRNPDLDTTAVRIANFAPIERVDVSTEP